jgi:hypothetical protein
METQHRSWFNSQTILGIAILLMGVFFLLDNTSVLDIGPFWKYWPIILIIAGAGKMIEADDKKGVIDGAWLAFIGTWLFISFNHIFGLSFRTSWPLLIVAWGVSILWKESAKNQNKEIPKGESYGQQ